MISQNCDNFYIYLQSNDDIAKLYYKNNHPLHFYNKLIKTINLVGDWECGLKQIIYSNTWTNVFLNKSENDKIWLHVYEDNSSFNKLYSISKNFRNGIYHSVGD